MSLAGVHITSEVFKTCVTHALSTEAEEIMGLLLGDVLYDDLGRAFARVWVAVPQIRTDRRKDRVEAGPEQLAQASAAAEQISESTQRRTRVIGWYHSHPHITVLPSHVDVRTQAMYQGLDEGFIGLIFSVFNQSSEPRSQRVQMTAFQSMQQGLDPSTPAQRGSWDFDSSMAAAIAASMEEAKANAAVGGQWIQKRVPLAVVPPVDIPESNSQNLRDLCKVLFDEERHAFQQAKQAAADKDGRLDPLTAVHQAAEYQQHLAKLLELVLAPALASTRGGHRQTQLQQQQLRDLRDSLVVRARRDRGGAPLPPPPNHLNHPPAERPARQPQANILEEIIQTDEFPDATAPPNAAHFGQDHANGSKQPAGSVVYTDWTRNPSEARQSHSNGQPAAANTAPDDAWEQSSSHNARNAAPVQASSATRSSEPPARYDWPAQTNWDAESPVARSSQTAGSVSSESLQREGGAAPYAVGELQGSSGGQGTERRHDAVTAWNKAVLRNQQGSAHSSPMRPSRTSSPGMQMRRGSNWQRDPFQALIDDDLAGLQISKRRNA